MLSVGFCNDPLSGITADKVRVDKADVSVKQSLCAAAVLVHRMIEFIINKRTDIFLPQPCAVKQYAIDLPYSRTELVLLVPKYQET